MDRTKIFGSFALVLCLTGCGLNKHGIAVGTKNFTEQVILGEIIAQHLEARMHRPIERKFNLGGTLLAHEALQTREIDLYPEYTGTALTNVLKREPIADPNVVLDQVRSAYESQMHLEWLNPLGFESTFAMTVRGVDARNRHLKTLSDAAADPAGFQLGAGYEFAQRPDGDATLNRGYNIHWTGTTKTMDLGLLYTALKQNKVSMIAANSTDGMLSAMDVTVLEDDKHAFPPYQACIVVRNDTLDTYPDLRTILNQLSGKISAEAMRKMNYQVDSEHRPVADVARDFLAAAHLK